MSLPRRREPVEARADGSFADSRSTVRLNTRKVQAVRINE
jgi:hypothetical protein